MQLSWVYINGYTSYKAVDKLKIKNGPGEPVAVFECNNHSLDKTNRKVHLLDEQFSSAFFKFV